MLLEKRYHLFDYLKCLNLKEEARWPNSCPGFFYNQNRNFLKPVGIKRKILRHELRPESGLIVTISRKIFTPDIDEMLGEFCAELFDYLSMYREDFEID